MKLVYGNDESNTEEDIEKELIAPEELSDAYEALKELIPQMEYDAIEMLFEELDNYRLPETDAETIAELKKALKVFDWDKMEQILSL